MSKPLTPKQAYDKARALEQAKHKYTTEGIHVICACGYIGTTETIGQHVEDYAETVGMQAREKEVARAIAEHEAQEAAKQRRVAADQSARLAILEKAREQQ